jgi:hypothetical protein
MADIITIEFVEKKLTYNKLINIFKKELDKESFLKVKLILEDNNIEERFHTKVITKKSNEKTYYQKISEEIFARLKKEKEENLEAFNEKYNKKSMLAIKNIIWAEEYKK